MTTTKAVLDLQTDLIQPNTPGSATEVASKGYVDLAVASATVPDATSAPGGASKGKLTMDEDKGLAIAGGIAEARIETTRGIEFVSGAIAAKVKTAGVPDGIEFSGSGEIKAKVDGTSIGINGGTGALEVLGGVIGDATAAPGGGVKGKISGDSDRGVGITAGVLEVKIDPVTLQYDGLGRLEVIGGGGGGGGSTGDVSQRAVFTRDITAVTPPTPATIGTQIDVLNHPNAVTTGQRFELSVPQDYYQGGLDLLVVYRMDAGIGGPNNQIRVTVAAEVADWGTGLVTTVLAETGQNVTTPTTTDLIRQQLVSIPEGQFSAGDTVQFFIKRIGGDIPNDLSSAVWQVVSYEWRYEAVVDSRVATQGIEFLQNASGETVPVPGTLGTQIDTVDFIVGDGQRFTCIVPENWDGQSDALIYFNYAMSSSSAAFVRLETSGEIANVDGGTIDVVGIQNYDISTTADTAIHRVAARTIPASALHIGDALTMKLARRTIGGDHAGLWRLVNVQVIFLVAPASGFNQLVVEEHYLEAPVFDVVSGTVFSAAEWPGFLTTFDQYQRMWSTAASGRIDVSFPGRLMSSQTQLAQIKVNILGIGATPQHRILVWVEGSGVVVYDSTLIPTPLVPTEYIITAGMLSAQPTLQKRFHIVVEAHIDNAEEVKVSLPFVRQE